MILLSGADEASKIRWEPALERILKSCCVTKQDMTIREATMKNQITCATRKRA